MRNPVTAWAAVAFALAACSQPPPPARTTDSATAAKPAAAVDTARLLAANNEPGNWMGPGRTYDEQRFSPLRKIDAGNVEQLGLAWFYDLDTAHRGQESTPLVIDGVMYVTSAWSKVFALDAKTGAPLWTYDPKVPGSAAVNACCDVVNRGVAAWKGRVYLGTLDGRLIALDAATGKPAWEVDDGSRRWPLHHHRRATRGEGHGADRQRRREMGVRGYVTAYDADTGKQMWRFYTVPGDPSKPFESPALEKAAKTWSGEWWKFGGGGPVWDSMVYDPTLDLHLHRRRQRHAVESRPRCAAMRLFLSSIVALKAETGEYVWHYQTTPGDEWDLRCLLADDPGRSRHRRQAARGAHAGAEERLLLCAGSRDRRAVVGRPLRDDQLGQGRGPQDWPPDARCPPRATARPASPSCRMPGAGRRA